MFRKRFALAAVLAAAAFSPVSPAQADKADRCEQKLERLEERFREIEAKRGYEKATQWWEHAWQRYWERCERP